MNLLYTPKTAKDEVAYRYLDLLKSVLTDTLDKLEPDRAQQDFGQQFLRHYMQGKALTCVPRLRLDHLQGMVYSVSHEGIEGDLLEAGVWRGGVTIFMRAVLDALYDKLSIGGFVIVDDYGEDQWTYCRQAVDDFREQRGIKEPLAALDGQCYWWRREK